MLPDGRRLGAHMSLSGGMVRAVDRAHAIGADAIQIFTDNPTAWRRRADPPRELDAFRERLAVHAIGPVAIHASYLVNLAGSDQRSREQSEAILAVELCGAPTFGASLVNVHIGSHLGDGARRGTRRLAETVERVLQTVRDDAPTWVDLVTAGAALPAMLVLENSAGSGGGLGRSVAELAGIAEALAARGIGPDMVGFCFDTAHAWGSGIDVGDPATIDTWLAEFDRRIGLERLVLVHLNDSRSPLGSRSDRHEHLGAGRIGVAGLGHVVRHPALGHATFMLETPGMDQGYDVVNLERARSMAAGRPLAKLPDEAFDLRGSAATRTPPP